VEAGSNESGLIMTNTGYIHLSLSELQESVLVHLISGVDEDAPVNGADDAVAAAITGYTEWVSEGGRVITIGWDWQMLAEDTAVRLRRISLPSSNVMLQSSSEGDLGHVTTARLLEDFVDAINWQPETLEYINVRYNA
jgi:hypothetical protein